jgi:hypothetical protein
MRPKLDRDDHEFVNRLAYSHYERECRLESLRSQMDTGYDKSTGQPLFQPVTGRGEWAVNRLNRLVGQEVRGLLIDSIDSLDKR